MKKIADSVLVSLADLLIIASLYGLPVLSRYLKEDLSILTLVLAFAVIPPLLLIAFVYTIRDLIRPGKRMQAIAALVLMVPTCLFLRSVKLDL